VDPATVHNCGTEKPSLDAEAKGYRRKVPRMKTPTTLLVLSLLSLDTVQAADTSRPTPADTRRYYNTQIVSEPQVSPDGKWVAYVVSTNDRDADESRSAIWMVSWRAHSKFNSPTPATTSAHLAGAATVAIFRTSTRLPARTKARSCFSIAAAARRGADRRHR